MTKDQVGTILARLQNRIAELKAFDVATIERRFDSKAEVLEQSINSTLADLFDRGSMEFAEYRVNLQPTAVMVSYHTETLSETRRGYQERIRDAVSQLEGLIRIESERILFSQPESPPVASDIPPAALKRVFVVHGTTSDQKNEVARFLTSIDLSPIILNEQANAGRTVIEKIEHYGKVGYAVGIMSPDDIALSGTGGEVELRARQNVLFELGYFMGSLRRSRVAVLFLPGTEIPSDLKGLVYIEYDHRGGWKIDLMRELREAGLAFDPSKAI